MGINRPADLREDDDLADILAHHANAAVARLMWGPRGWKKGWSRYKLGCALQQGIAALDSGESWT
jgi:hypothetical protein